MFRRASILMVATMLLGACSSAVPATTAPVATQIAASSAPTPSPTAPPDVAKLFLPQIIAATAGKIDLAGTLDLGGEAGALSGSYTFVGSDLDETLTTSLAGKVTTVAMIHKAGSAYTKVNTGPWLKDAAPPAAGKDLSSLLKGLTALTDAGLETKGGVSLHRLELPASAVLDPAAFGIAGAAFVDPKVTMVFFADDTGKPVYMSVTVTWTQNAQPISMTLDFHFVQLGGSLRVSAPEHVWPVFTSKRFGYRIAYPDDWDVDVTTSKTDDEFISPVEDTGAFVNRTKISGYTLNQIVSSVISYDKSLKYTFNSNVAYTLAGTKARFLTLHGTLTNGTKVVVYSVITLRGGYAYEIDWVSPADPEHAELVVFKQLLGTFAFKP